MLSEFVYKELYRMHVTAVMLGRQKCI